MSETSTPLRPVSIDYLCDACGIGHMRPTGIMLTSHPPQFPHRCDHCDAHQNFDVRYPHVRYEEEKA